MTVYIDVILMENLCMNYIILFATGLIIKTKLKHIRILLSALLGSMYAILLYMQILSIYSNISTKIILSIVMVYLAFTPKNIIALSKELLIFYLVSFALGGCSFALLYLIKPQDIFIINGVYIGTYPIKIVALSGITGFIIIYNAFNIIKNKLNKKSLIYDIEIKIDEKIIMVKALFDTGNMLKDPISGMPVIIVEKDELYGILPSKILNNINKILGGDWKENEEYLNYKLRLRIIPFNSIGKQNGMLLGFKADEIKIKTDINEIINKDVIICVYQERLTKTNAYCALIGLDVLEGRKKDELITNIKG